MRFLIICLIALLVTTSFAAQCNASVIRHDIVINGQKRSYLLHSTLTSGNHSPVPLVIMLHGGFGSGSQAEKAYGWDKQADKHGFVVAYPDGIGRSWNAGGICCGPAMKNNIDDLGFITSIISDISGIVSIDPKRIYLTGISNGAAMSYRYACEGTYHIAAIGTVAGSLSYACNTQHPVSVMEIHGMDDQNIPFTGGIGAKGVTKVDWLPVQQSLDKFRQVANCGKPVLSRTATVETSVSSCPDGNEIVLITIGGAGHQWPGSKPAGRFKALFLPVDSPSSAIDATSTLWAFFHKHEAKQ